MSKPLTAWRLEAAVSAAMQAIDGLPEDERLRRDTIEGETGLFELLDDYAASAIADRLLAERATERVKRLEARAERARAIIASVMQALELTDPLQRPLYTAALTHTRHVVVTDETALPAGCIRHSPDKVTIGKMLRRGEDVPGATLGNPQPQLRLTTQ